MDTPVATTPNAEVSAQADALAVMLRAKFDESKAARLLYEQEWLKDLRQYLGVYDPEFAQRMDPNRSRAFIRVTRTKIKAMDARLKDMMFPAGGDKNWAIQPTPVPSEVEQMTMAVAQRITALQPMTGGAPTDQPAPSSQPIGQPPGSEPVLQVTPRVPKALGVIEKIAALFSNKAAQNQVADNLAEAAMQDARERCKRMEKTIDDQLDECHYASLCAEVIHSGDLFGTGILKGPMVQIRKEGSWSVGDDAAVYIERDNPRPYAEAVPIWDIYPDMNATKIEDAEFVIQRHVMLKSDLRKLGTRPDFNVGAINDWIMSQPDGDSELLWYEAQMRAINQNTTKIERTRRYEVLEYWGYVDGSDLQRHGIDVPEQTLNQEFEANVWVLGNRVIKAVLNPYDAGFRPYQWTYFDRDETGIFGVGIARILRDTQALYNACVRAAVDNAALSAGPMFEVTKDLLAPGEDSETIAPLRVFLRKSGQGNAPAIRSITVPNTGAELLTLANLFKQMGDEATTIPAYTHGEQDHGVARTVGGLSMLMGAANITIKDTVRNFDYGITEPFIRAMYHWNMQFNPDPLIKGDYNVSARGSTSLVAKELRANQLAQMATSTANPLDSPYVKRRELLRERFYSLDLDPDHYLYEEDEVEQRMQHAQEMQPPDPSMLKYQIEMGNLQLKEFVEKGKLAIDQAELNLKTREEALKEQEARLVTAHQNLARIIEQLRVTL